MNEAGKSESLLGLFKKKKRDKLLLPSSGSSIRRTREILMNDAGVIEVGPKDRTKIIGTSSLGGCLAIAAIVEDSDSKRRCGLAHYDPMMLRLELERGSLESIARLFHSTALVDNDKLVKKGVVVMAEDPSGQQKAFIDGIKTEAHYLLGCDNIIVIRYGSQLSDRLDVIVPNHNGGSPFYTTTTKSGEVW